MSVFKRVLSDLKNRRDRILSDKINCIPWGLPRFEESSPGIEQGKYYLITANSKVGKTQLADFLFLFNTIQQIIDNKLNVRLKIFYFTLEMSKEEKMLSAFANILYVKEGIRVSPTDLRSTHAERLLPIEVLEAIEKYEEYFNKIEEIVEFVDDVRHPTGIYKMVSNYAKANGVQHTKVVKFTNNKTKETYDKEIDDWYEPNDPEEYVMCMIDHISLISTETKGGKKMSLQESIVELSSNYLIRLRNKYNYIPVVIQQQAAAQESLDNFKAMKLKPTLDGLGDSKLTARDANLIIGIFSPFRHGIPEYRSYDTTFFRDNIRFMEVIASRSGGAGATTPLYFDGAVNYFKELPRPDDEKNINKVKAFIKKLRDE